MGLKIDQNNPFIACWNESNAKINPNRGGFLENSIRKVKNIILYIPNFIVATCINPRSETQFYPSPKLAGNFGSFTKEVITPDQVHLTAHVHVIDGATSNTPTVILFNPLGANDSIHYELKANLTARKVNVITFDYRGLGNTRGAANFLVDGDSMLQYTTEELGTNKNKVHFYGFSLGGAIAAQVKALHPESAGKYVGDRPFKSVFSLITENCCIERFGPLIKKTTSLVSAIFIAYPIYLLGWEWDGSKILTQLNGNKRVVYHPNDFLIPFEASLASQCPTEQVIRLNPRENGPFTHFSPIEAHDTAEGTPAINVIVDFLSQ